MCDCFKRLDAAMKKDGVKIHSGCVRIAITPELGLADSYCLPLERLDGKKLRRNDPGSIRINHCPFCGESLPEPKSKKATKP